MNGKTNNTNNDTTGTMNTTDSMSDTSGSIAQGKVVSRSGRALVIDTEAGNRMTF